MKPVARQMDDFDTDLRNAIQDIRKIKKAIAELTIKVEQLTPKINVASKAVKSQHSTGQDS